MSRGHKPLSQKGNADLSGSYPKTYPQKQWITRAAAVYFRAACTMSRTLSKPAMYCGFSERASSVE
ncbi:Uncharacterised protein [Bordetella pseudohinzii]|uniref:Uncharacterized protein n=1 Tax=Bordetella pseudohinzii TaxID=1331258 RepID=A0A0M7G813_9BORD|nr:Uncharacterised protein [Bordetella pseudohinzii]